MTVTYTGFFIFLRDKTFLRGLNLGTMPEWGSWIGWGEDTWGNELINKRLIVPLKSSVKIHTLINLSFLFTCNLLSTGKIDLNLLDLLLIYYYHSVGANGRWYFVGRTFLKVAILHTMRGKPSYFVHLRVTFIPNSRGGRTNFSLNHHSIKGSPINEVHSLLSFPYNIHWQH
jgi:hypothetical protein